MFNALFGIVGDVVKVADAVVEVPLGVVRAVTKPIGELAEEIKDELLEEFED